jgi:hypothetical protein
MHPVILHVLALNTVGGIESMLAAYLAAAWGGGFQHHVAVWGRPVHLETIHDNKRILLSCDGDRNSKSPLDK